MSVVETLLRVVAMLQVYAELSPKPIAAASLGQVQRIPSAILFYSINCRMHRAYAAESYALELTGDKNSSNTSFAQDTHW